MKERLFIRKQQFPFGCSDYCKAPHKTVYFVSSTGFHDEATFSVTQMGGLKLVHHGYQYHKKREHKGVTYWRCKKSKILKCKALAHTKNFDGKQLVKISGAHNHFADYNNFESGKESPFQQY